MGSLPALPSSSAIGQALPPAVTGLSRTGRHSGKGDGGIRAAGADPLSHLPPRNAMGWWTGSRSTCAAWQPCVAAPLAGPACARCSLPTLGAVPRRVPRLPGGARPSAVSLLSQPVQLGGTQELSRGRGGLPGGPLTVADCWLACSRRHRECGILRGDRAAEAMPLTCLCLCVQLSCVLGARSTRSVPRCAVEAAGSQRTAGSWAAVWLVVTAPQGCSGTPRASVCPPACAPASSEPVAMPLAVPP